MKHNCIANYTLMSVYKKCDIDMTAYVFLHTLAIHEDYFIATPHRLNEARQFDR